MFFSPPFVYTYLLGIALNPYFHLGFLKGMFSLLVNERGYWEGAEGKGGRRGKGEDGFFFFRCWCWLLVLVCFCAWVGFFLLEFDLMRWKGGAREGSERGE